MLEQSLFFGVMKHVQVTLENEYFNIHSMFINTGTDIVFEHCYFSETRIKKEKDKYVSCPFERTRKLESIFRTYDVGTKFLFLIHETCSTETRIKKEKDKCLFH